MDTLRRWLSRKLYNLVTEEEKRQALSVNWHRDIISCVYCPRPIPTGSAFCPYCGAAQIRETDRIEQLSTATTQTIKLPPGTVIRAYHQFHKKANKP